MISFGVQYSKYNDTISFHTIKELIRKSSSDQAAETVVINWPLFGALSQKSNCAFDFIQQIIT